MGAKGASINDRWSSSGNNAATKGVSGMMGWSTSSATDLSSRSTRGAIVSKADHKKYDTSVFVHRRGRDALAYPNHGFANSSTSTSMQGISSQRKGKIRRNVSGQRTTRKLASPLHSSRFDESPSPPKAPSGNSSSSSSAFDFSKSMSPPRFMQSEIAKVLQRTHRHGATVSGRNLFGAAPRQHASIKSMTFSKPEGTNSSGDGPGRVISWSGIQNSASAFGALDSSAKDIERVLSSTNISTMGSSNAATAAMSSNPFKPSARRMGDGVPESFLAIEEEAYQRWTNLFPKEAAKDVFQSQIDALGRREVMWRSLENPGVLPLTTDTMPSAKDLAASYVVNFYTVSLPEDYTDEEYNGDSDLLKEMIAQRLSQDFQIISTSLDPRGGPKTPAGSPARPASIRRPHNGDAPSPSRTLSGDVSSTVTLSMGHQLHVLAYDALSRNIEVQRYEHISRANASGNMKQTYNYLLWDDLEGRATMGSYDFSSNLVFYNWNYIDQIVCGYDDDLSGTVPL